MNWFEINPYPLGDIRYHGTIHAFSNLQPNKHRNMVRQNLMQHNYINKTFRNSSEKVPNTNYLLHLVFELKSYIVNYVLGFKVPFFGCLQCGKQYKYASGLYTHQKYECGKIPNHQCELCQYISFYPQNLKRHLMLRHGYSK